MYLPFKVPKRAILSSEALSFKNAGKTPSLLTIKHRRYVTSGRAAIAIALQQIGIEENDDVLVPAYHCPAMVAPIRHHGAKPIFYEINQDTSVKLEDAESKITASTRAIIIVHYFGFPQDMDSILELCRSHDLILIEDCAHACYGQYKDQPLGSFGDYSIGSMMKFFPVFDGGLITSSNNNLDNVDLSSAGIMFETQAMTIMLEYAFQYGRMKALRFPAGLALKAKDILWNTIKKGKKQSTPIRPAASHGGQALDPSWLKKSISASSRFVVEHTDQDRLTGKRRQNYQALNRALASLPGMTPLHRHLPDNVVPYVFPVVVDAPNRIYQTLRAKGIPVVRFAEESSHEQGVGNCPISTRLSRQSLQFPCHQDLGEEELQWMIETAKAVFNDQNSRNLNTPPMSAKVSNVATRSISDWLRGNG